MSTSGRSTDGLEMIRLVADADALAVLKEHREAFQDALVERELRAGDRLLFRGALLAVDVTEPEGPAQVSLQTRIRIGRSADPIVLSCGACDATASGSQRFCGQCGAPLPLVDLEAPPESTREEPPEPAEPEPTAAPAPDEPNEEPVMETEPVDERPPTPRGLLVLAIVSFGKAAAMALAALSFTIGGILGNDIWRDAQRDTDDLMWPIVVVTYLTAVFLSSAGLCYVGRGAKPGIGRRTGNLYVIFACVLAVILLIADQGAPVLLTLLLPIVTVILVNTTYRDHLEVAYLSKAQVEFNLKRRRRVAFKRRISKPHRAKPASVPARGSQSAPSRTRRQGQPAEKKGSRWAGLFGIIVGGGMVYGGLTGVLVTKGTDTSIPVIIFGAIFFLGGVALLFERKKE